MSNFVSDISQFDVSPSSLGMDELEDWKLGQASVWSIIPRTPRTPDSGACCSGEWPLITCSIMSNASCVAASGHYLGNGSTCSGVDCNSGACCHFDGTCDDTPSFLCGDCAIGHSCWLGAGTSCATDECLGACCCFREDGESTCDGNITYAACLAGCPSPPYSSGWLLNGACSDLGCPSPGVSGACCVDGECSIVGPSHCEGTYIGDGTTCDPDPCTPTGACCVGRDCSIATEGDCEGMGGVYHGNGVPCIPDPCPPACPCGGFTNWHLPGRTFLTFKAHGHYTTSGHTDCRIDPDAGCPFCAGGCEFAGTCTVEEATANINPETCEFTETVGNYTSTTTVNNVCVCSNEEDPCDCEVNEEPTCRQVQPLPDDVTGTHHVFYPLQACGFNTLVVEMDREIVNGDRSATITETLTIEQNDVCGKYKVDMWEAVYEYSNECVDEEGTSIW